MKHINIPVFIPHLGCPNDCVFCNQRSISGKMAFSEENVEREIEEVLATLRGKYEAEIAFFGGSFTGIDRGLMIRLLDKAQTYVDSGRVQSIRLSTRPDYISEEILEILSRYAVKTIELGLQSMNDEVLSASRRGHDVACAVRACKMVKKAGFSLVGQMMIGLPTSSAEAERETARRLCEMGVDAARVYPTVVFYDTALCEMAKRGEYTPFSTDDAVMRTKNVLAVFDKFDVPVIRVGLCASDNLSSPDMVYGGASHAAIGELAMGELFYDKMCEQLDKMGDLEGKEVQISVPHGALSKAIGQKRKNLTRICEKYSLKRLKILEKSEKIGYNIMIDSIV